MEVDSDAPSHKRLRLDSVTPTTTTYNGLPFPPHTQPHSQPNPPLRHHSVTASPTTRQYPAHSLPPPPPPPPAPSQSYPPPHSQGPPPAHHQQQQQQHHQQHHQQQHPPPPPPGPSPGSYQPPAPSPSLPPTDLRSYQDPRTIPSPGQRTHGAPPVTHPNRTPTVAQDSINDYSSRPGVTPRSSAPDIPSSRPASVETKPPVMDHGNHQAQWSTPDHRPSVTYSNGYPAPAVVSPPHPHDQQFHTPPLPQAQHYGQPVQAYTPGPYMPGPSGQYAGQGQIRRKQVRATQACNHCRSRKQKCDEARPCQFCRENNFDCQYKDVPPPKQDRSMMQLQDSVSSISSTLEKFIERFGAFERAVETRLQGQTFKQDDQMSMLSHPSPEQSYGMRASFSHPGGTRMPTPVQGRGQLHRVNSMKTESPVVANSNMSPIAAHASTPIKQEAMLAAPQPPATPADSVRTDQTSTAQDNKEKTGLQGDHTTPAHQLLYDWTSMKEFCDGVETITKLKNAGYKVYDYPMQLERSRGLVRVWGVGEGLDQNDGAQGPGSPDSHESGDSPSPASGGEGLWGPVEPSSPSTMSADSDKSDDRLPGGLDADGRLKLDSETLNRLLNSYHTHIHTLHPFLNPSKLRRMVKEFGNMYSPDAKPGNAHSPNSAAHAGLKRKRSGSTFLDPHSANRERSPDMIEKSLRNAIVLLILALGKVSEYQGPLPAPIPDKDPITNVYGVKDSPNNSFSNCGTDSRKRNIDILPGMAYFSYATDILGNQQGGNTVAHAQAMVLAALYLAQYARVLESWSWINNACRVCLVLIKADMSKINRSNVIGPMNQANMPQQPQLPQQELFRLNLVKCIYWTCLQLETDILAEMSNLPPTDVSKYQEDVSYPSGVFEKLPEDMPYNEGTHHEKTMWIYSSQIHLRVILNEAHNTLYGNGGRNRPSLDANNLKEVAVKATVHAEILRSWRLLLPPDLIWDDEDPPSEDLNIARLRAKFYGGLYMILRPFLDMAVHEMELPPGPPRSSSVWSSQTNSPAMANDSVATPTTQHSNRASFVDLTPEQSEILKVAGECVQSAMRSTIAFDRVGADPNTPYNEYYDTPKRRLILTNIFGTLHAQFGNMIVLAAVYKNEKLRQHLPANTQFTKRTLSLLFRRTILMLKEVKPNSPVLSVDADILENVQRILRLDCC
ncbi:hypothetical protein BU24DRAFT_412742 [Aaosphaeria arxii CBS 175.79]|uniref:Zn(2)-C6 fungal-type domain-containing protein n=1 Tax=Aaosphaeria arxii CBS 175.79 TaxID=1450172 RepID=A0A6A5XGC8_9PLEO|nr:uncharacterized protein BU24DRAFT_412742 [Aaosphaeria arxii CBS 175.79]KAF2012228.1 hypothetical protein BU24DRAFT_412742 [Aaosphaeria arxii CBS 175.79]